MTTAVFYWEQSMAAQRVRLATKLAGSFALMVLIAGVLGGVGWWSFTRIATTVHASTAATDCILALDAARAHERDFKVRGFAKDAASGKSSDELWGEAQAHLEQMLAKLPETPGFSADDQEHSRAAAQAGAAYAQAFATLTTSRKARDEGFQGWIDIGWKLTEKVGAARTETIDPARAAARAAADLAAVQRWDEIALGLDQGVIQNFLLMRLLGAFLGATQSDEIWEKYQAHYTKTQEALAAWTALVAGEANLEAAARQLGEYIDQHKACGQKFYDAIVESRKADAALATAAGAVTGDCDELAHVQERNMQTAIARGRTLMVGFAAGGLLAGLLLGTLLTRSITRPINRIVAALTDGARQVNDAAQQVAGASQQLASGASEQAASLEETSSALEQMAAMTRTNADNARKASELSEQARIAAQSGDQVMARLNTSMAGINEASAQISKIIKVIEEIAFQTNLLALNAAVEAARAGEHGKGFAVVAEEVRNLAQRAAQAARETTTLIESSVNRAKEGAGVATDVTKALGGIVGDVAKVSELIEGIARASAEQAQGVDQVNLAVNQMDKVTQQNAASAEESASAAEQLSAQAVAVDGVVAELAALIRGDRAGGAERSEPAPPQKPAVPPGRPQERNIHRSDDPNREGPPGDF